MALSAKQVRFFHELLSKRSEACGTWSGNEIVLHSFGPSTGRGLCEYRKYAPVIWHTHPLRSKPYPSHEDIVKVLKNKVIDISLIFTAWGIWEISYMGKVRTFVWEKAPSLIRKCTEPLYYLPKYNNKTVYKAVRCLKLRLHKLAPGFHVRFQSWPRALNEGYKFGRQRSRRVA